MKIWLMSCLILVQILAHNDRAYADQKPITLDEQSQSGAAGKIEEQTRTADTPSIEITPFRAEYVAYRSGSDVGGASLELTAHSTLSNTFELRYRSDVSKFFLSDKRYETTLFSVDDQRQLSPIEYVYKRTGTGPNDALRAVFNKISQTITIDDKTQLDWTGQLDNQLFRIDFPRKLSTGITSASYDFINYRGQNRHYELEIVKTESLSLPFGVLETVKVKINRQSKTRITYAWFAPALNYNLVRLQQFKDDKEQGDMKLSNFSYL